MAERPVLALCRENNGTVGTAVPSPWRLQPGEQEKPGSFCMTCVFSPEPRKRGRGGERKWRRHRKGLDCGKTNGCRCQQPPLPRKTGTRDPFPTKA